MENKIKKPFYKKWWVWTIVVIVILALAAGGGGGDSNESEGDTGPEVAQTSGEVSEDTQQQVQESEPVSEPEEQSKEEVEQPEEQEEPEPKGPETYNIGDTVEAGDYIFTVNSVREDKGGDFLKPDEGNIYYIIDATVENKGDKSINVSSLLMFTLIDEEGYTYDITFGPDTKGQLDGEIAPGRKLRGELAFEIPADATGLELEIDPSLFGDGKIIYKLDR